MSRDQQLLERYVSENSEQAFSELVRGHVDLVYSAAVRLARGDNFRAQDITQQVFVELARKARKLKHHPALTGWLYTTTRLMALRSDRAERRRAFREQEAYRMNELLQQEAPEPAWADLQPVLDAAMHDLNDQDRLAVLLRYFQNKPLKEVGATLGLAENTARMRVERALEKLRTHLERRGVRSTAATLAVALMAHAVTAAPASLAASVGTASVAAAAASGSAFTIYNLANMTTLKIGLITAAVAGGIATPVLVQHKTQTELRAENASLRHQLEPVNALEAENARLSNLVAGIDREALDRQAAELVRLRGEVAQLRRLTNSLAQLQRDNAALRAQAATGNQAEEAVAAETARLKPLFHAKLLALTMFMAATRNQNQFPENWDQPTLFVEEAVRNSANSGQPMQDLAEVFQATNQFEIMLSGPIKAISKPATTIMLRERQPRQLPDGTWVKAYAFADGHAEFHTEPDGNFSRYEAEHSVSAQQ